VNTKEQCIDILNDFSFDTKVLRFLPKDDKSNINFEIAKEILNLLIKVAENLFRDSSKEECIQFRSKLEECDCFHTLLFLLNIYENISFKVRISIILGNFYKFIAIPNEGKIIIDIFINYLKEQSTEKSNEDENNELMISVLRVLADISLKVDNEKILSGGGIIPLLLPLVSSLDTNIWQNTVFLLSNICCTTSYKNRESIINCGIYDVFHKKLLEISPFPPQKMISSNYFSISRIIAGINKLIIVNRTSFSKTPLIPLLLHTLDSTISIRNTSSDENIGKIQEYICNCFLSCSFLSYENMLLLVEMKVIDSLLNIIEMYINEIKKKKILLNEDTVETISDIFFLMEFLDFSEKKNEFKNYFDKNNRLNILLNLFKCLISQTLSPIQKTTTDKISVTICKLLKNKKPPLSYGCVLQYVNKLKLSPSPTSGYDFPSHAKIAWYEMSKADECLWNIYQFKEIIVVQNFDVENGLLGLHKYIYLNIIRFLDSSVVRKV
jgi:hypothetical protein